MIRLIFIHVKTMYTLLQKRTTQQYLINNQMKEKHTIFITVTLFETKRFGY